MPKISVIGGAEIIMEKKFKGSKFSLFIKKNIYLILMIVCLLAIIGMVAYTFAKQKPSDSEPAASIDPDNKSQEDPNKDVTDDNKKPEDETKNVLKEIGLPVANAEVIKDYSDTELVFNATMKHWATHQGIDYKIEKGTNVLAVYDGVVTDVSTSTLKGTTVTIKHSDGFESVYSLLGSDVKVKEGDSVKKGMVLGSVDESGVFESADGLHLHFEFKKDGKLIDPNLYFKDANK